MRPEGDVVCTEPTAIFGSTSLVRWMNLALRGRKHSLDVGVVRVDPGGTRRRRSVGPHRHRCHGEAMIRRQARGTAEDVEEFSCDSSKFRYREIRILYSLGDEVEWGRSEMRGKLIGRKEGTRKQPGWICLFVVHNCLPGKSLYPQTPTSSTWLDYNIHYR